MDSLKNLSVFSRLRLHLHSDDKEKNQVCSLFGFLQIFVLAFHVNFCSNSLENITKWFELDEDDLKNIILEKDSDIKSSTFVINNHPKYDIMGEWSELTEKKFKEHFNGQNINVYGKNHNEICELVNQIIHDETNGLMKNLFQSYVFHNLRIKIMNIVYFTFKWIPKMFKEEHITFHINDKNKIEVDGMSMKEGMELPYYKSNHYELVKIPFHNSSNSIIIGLPEYFKRTEFTLNLFKSEDIKKMKKQYISEIVIPNFNFNSKTKFDSPIMNKMLCKAFNLESLEYFSLSQTCHIKFDKDGVECASCTSYDALDCVFPKQINIYVNRPFFFFIINEKDMIYSHGVVHNPHQKIHS